MPTRGSSEDVWGKQLLDTAVNAYLTSAPQSKGSEVITNLNRNIMVLIGKVESLESTNIILMAEKSSMDKTLLEIKTQGNKMEGSGRKKRAEERLGQGNMVNG